MHHGPIEAATVPHPASKWTSEVRARFLEHLSRKGNVRAACLLVGASTETAYRLRRRDRAFARGWDAAMALARRAAEHVLADRAIDGVVVDIYHRGEWVASQRKYDSRLLLAHLGRLDRQVKAQAEADADRFDEILASIIGEPVPFELASDDEFLAVDRERFAAEAGRAARYQHENRLAADNADGDEELDSAARWARDEAREAECAEAEADARDEARWHWDQWHGQVCAAVDAALEGVLADDGEPDTAGDEPAAGDGPEAPETACRGDADISLRTASTVSTPADAANPQGEGAARQDGPLDDRAGEPAQ